MLLATLTDPTLTARIVRRRILLVEIALQKLLFVGLHRCCFRVARCRCALIVCESDQILWLLLCPWWTLSNSVILLISTSWAFFFIVSVCCWGGHLWFVNKFQSIVLLNLAWRIVVFVNCRIPLKIPSILLCESIENIVVAFAFSDKAFIIHPFTNSSLWFLLFYFLFLLFPFFCQWSSVFLLLCNLLFDHILFDDFCTPLVKLYLRVQLLFFLFLLLDITFLEFCFFCLSLLLGFV